METWLIVVIVLIMIWPFIAYVTTKLIVFAYYRAKKQAESYNQERDEDGY